MALAGGGLRLVLTGCGNEASLTAALSKVLDAPVLNLAGRTGFGCLADLLSRTRLFVCNDTGVSHLRYDSLRELRKDYPRCTKTDTG